MQESSYCFWPEGSSSAGVDGAEEVYGKLTVTLKRLSGYGDITERRLNVAESEGTSAHRIVTLLQLSSWPLEEVPHPSAILSLVDLLSKAQRTSPSRHIIVMCRCTDKIILTLGAHAQRGLPYLSVCVCVYVCVDYYSRATGYKTTIE